MLRRHPEVSGFSGTGVPKDEGQHLQSVFPSARYYGGPGRFGFHPEAHMTEDHPLLTASFQVQLLSEWEPYWDLNKSILIEKSPPNILRTRFLQALLPNTYFSVIIRHPIAVSMATQKWSKTSLSSLMQHWLLVHRKFEDDRPHLANLCILSYEELIHSPVAVLDRIGRFLGIDLVTQNPPLDHNTKYFNQWNTPGPRAALSRKWLTYLYEKHVGPFGYSLSHPEMYPVHA
jgi:hypothetical protein